MADHGHGGDHGGGHGHGDHGGGHGHGHDDHGHGGGDHGGGHKKKGGDHGGGHGGGGKGGGGLFKFAVYAFLISLGLVLVNRAWQWVAKETKVSKNPPSLTTEALKGADKAVDWTRDNSHAITDTLNGLSHKRPAKASPKATVTSASAPKHK